VGVLMLLVLNLVLIVGFIGARTISGAYLPMMVPGIILLIAAAMGYKVIKLSSYKVIRTGFFLRLASYILYLLLVVVVACNSYYSFVKNGSDYSFRERLDAGKYIVKEAGGKEYNLLGKGGASQFESFTMNYEYLTWWMGNGPTKTKKQLRFIISEDGKGIHVEKQVK
jgi:hypothetical protein